MTENPLVAQVRSGESPELRVLAAQGILPIAPSDLIPLQVELAQSDDELTADYARKSLDAVDSRFVAALLTTDASHEVLGYFAETSRDALVLEAVIRRRDTPRVLMVDLARRLPADLQEILLLRQDAIVECPDILRALEENPAASIYSKRRILEYREHLLPRERKARVETTAPVEAAAEELDAADWEEIEKAKDLPKEGELDTSTGLTEGQIRSLPVPVRMKLTRGASRTLRGILIKDANPLVATAVLANAAMSEDEVEQIAASRTVVDEVLAAVARKREWVSRYNVALALVRNPRTQVGVGVRLVARISVRDLKTLRRDRNVSDAVRSQADRLYKIKSQ
ncbi:MAG: hypothetical protein KDB94_03660 [Acidobacteria bacterium]|nr:hypothetical protein [Acidobacteriota bacterium]